VAQIIQQQREGLSADVDAARAEVQSFFITAAVTLTLFIGFLVVLFASVILSVFRLTGSLEHTSRSVVSVLAKAAAATQSMREIATKTSRASIEQATAIQETVATLNEITSMARSTQENVIRSANSANRSASTTQTGVQRMDDMLSIVSKIEHSVSDLSQAIDENNRKMTEVIRTVNNIQQESRAIEDIAFNTRIISFNAAVEAARAGQAGLSFKVVAEEVNNLAVQSSESAKRIKEIMAQSSQQVAQIVEQTTESSTQFVSKSNEHTAVGVEISDECRTIMRHVLEQVLEVKSNMDAIGSANEQVTEGVANINKAMQDLDMNTSIGSDMAARTAELADELSAQTLLAMESMQKLETKIFGGAVLVRPDADSQESDQDQSPMEEEEDSLKRAS
jgi:methyl-accepting chemotaxis protein